ncbi:MAG: hypothetical protein Q3983_03675 [Capnocytophaga sp.]|nr:hypothetical protein [Capnocytophaga sp.]
MLEKKYEDTFDYFPQEVLEALAIAKKQSILGKTISNTDVFKDIETSITKDLETELRRRYENFKQNPEQGFSLENLENIRNRSRKT